MRVLVILRFFVFVFFPDHEAVAEDKHNNSSGDDTVFDLCKRHT